MEIAVCKVPSIHTPILKQKGAITVTFVRAKRTLVHIAVLVLVNAPTMSTIKNERTFIAVAIWRPQNAVTVPVVPSRDCHELVSLEPETVFHN